MMKRSLIVAGMLAILTSPVVFAAGTPNLGCADVLGQGSAFMFDARAFDTLEDQDTLDNAVYTLGYAASVNSDVDFCIGFSNIDVAADYGVELDAAQYYGSTLTIDRKVLAPSLKWRISKAGNLPAMALTVGADIALDRNSVILDGIYPGQSGYGSTYLYDDFVPAAKLQAMWGKAGKFQFQLAGQANFFSSEGRYSGYDYEDESYPTQSSYAPTAPGTVIALGGGVVWPLSSKLSVSGDYMSIVDGHNAVCYCGGMHLEEDVWSAGLNYAFSGSNLSVYATNSLAPTLVDSIMASADNATAVAARWSTSW